MAGLWKSNTQQKLPKNAGKPLEHVMCVGRALQPSSDAADKHIKGTSCKARQQQTRYPIRSRFKPTKPASESDDKSMLSIDQRANTVDVERWSRCPDESGANKVQTSRLSKFSLRPVIVSQDGAKTQVAEDLQAGTLESTLSLLGANVRMESPYLKRQQRQKAVINSFKPLKPVAPQQPSILQCVGITPDPRIEPANHQHSSGTARVFRHFYEVVLEEPQRADRRTAKQRSALDYGRWQWENYGGFLDEHLDTQVDSMQEAVQLRLAGLSLQRGCGTVGQRRCGSPAGMHPGKEACGRGLVSDDSADISGYADGLEDYSTEDTSKETDCFYNTKWDPGQLKVTFKLKNSNVMLSFSQKPST